MAEFITLIGDVHGNIIPYMKLLERRCAGKRTIQLGDMGLGFAGVNLPTMPKHKFLRGNHDSPDMCRVHPNYLGDFGQTEDGIFFISGAFSIDHAWRTPGVSWWFDEELSEAQWEKVLALYEQVKPEFVVSHECPASVNKALLGPHILKTENYYSRKLDCKSSRTCHYMEELLRIHAPERWAFGHYHVSWMAQLGDTKFFCLPELGVREFEL